MSNAKTFEHTGTGEIILTNRELALAAPSTFVELREHDDDADIVWDEEFRAFMVNRIEEGTQKEFRWDYVHLTNNKLMERR